MQQAKRRPITLTATHYLDVLIKARQVARSLGCNPTQALAELARAGAESPRFTKRR